MVFLLPIFVAAASLWALSCSPEEKPKRINPDELIIGPEPLPKNPPKTIEARLSGGAQEVLQNFRGRLEEKGVFRGLNTVEQRRLEETFQANSLNGFFRSMLTLSKDFEAKGRPDLALKIDETLISPQFPVPSDISSEAQDRLSSVAKSVPSSLRP